MSNLYKQALNKNKPPIPQNLKGKVLFKDSDSEEETDNYPTNLNQANIQYQPKQLYKNPPLDYKEFYDELFWYNELTPIYKTGQQPTIFFCLHGAGDTAASFAFLAKQIVTFASLVSFDFRGHGASKIQDTDFSCDKLVNDSLDILKFICCKFPNSMIILAGHSMGGSVSAKLTQKAMDSDVKDRIQGTIIIDVVEGTAIQALPFMEDLVKNRPQEFGSIEQAIDWTIKSSTVRNKESARVSVPPKLVKKDDLYYWKVDLLKTQPYWLGWYQGFTQCFLNAKIPKMILLAEKDRMDKEMTIAHMQGRFKLVVLQEVGHYVQEDNYQKMAVDKDEYEDINKNGITKFKSKLPEYSDSSVKLNFA